MPIDVGSFNVTKFKSDPEFYLYPPFRNRNFLSICIGFALICILSVGIVVKDWNRLSVSAIVAISAGMYFAILLLRMVLRSHAALHQLLTSGQVEPPDKGSPLGVVLNLLADVSNGALFLSFLSICGLLLAIIKIASGH